MALAEYVEKELRDAGAFDEDSNYGGIGPEVMELIRVFVAQGHSGGSADLVLNVFNRVARFKPLSPLKNPMVTGEYIEYKEHGLLQSTRNSAVMSDDGGKTWFDVDKPVPIWMKLRGHRKVFIRNWAE